MSFKLITIYYESENQGRNGEVEVCLEINCMAFDDVTVVAENTPRLPWFKGRWINMPRLQTVEDLLRAARDSQPTSGDIVAVANGDIFFTHVALAEIDANLRANEAFCLSRWDFTTDGLQLFDRADSQDAWIFRGAPRVRGCNYNIASPGIDNRFAHDIEAAGYTVSNPSKDIRLRHCHLVNYRPRNKADNRIPLPYLYVTPTRIGEPTQLCRPQSVSRAPSSFRTVNSTGTVHAGSH